MLILVCIGITGTLMFYSYYYVIDSKDIGMKLIVADFYGFDLNPKNLTFGATVPGGSTRRDLYLSNIYGEPVRVRIKLSGELAPMVGLSKKDFIMEPGEKIQIIASASAPETSKNGTVYYGSLKVLFTKAW